MASILSWGVLLAASSTSCSRISLSRVVRASFLWSRPREALFPGVSGWIGCPM
jgi:hypothetical protein